MNSITINDNDDENDKDSLGRASRLPVTGAASAYTVGTARGNLDACQCIAAVFLANREEADEDDDEEPEADLRAVVAVLYQTEGRKGTARELHNLFVRPAHRDKHVPERYKQRFCDAYVKAFKAELRRMAEALRNP
jgi:hypothetical protein